MTARAGKRLTVADISPQERYFLSLRPSANISVPNGTATSVTNWTPVTGTSDPEGWSNGTVVTFPRAGFVIEHVAARWELNGVGYRAMLLDRVGVGRLSTVTVQPFRETGECLVYANRVEAGEQHYVRGQQGAGGNLTLFATEQTMWRILFLGEGAAA